MLVWSIKGLKLVMNSNVAKNAFRIGVEIFTNLIALHRIPTMDRNAG